MNLAQRVLGAIFGSRARQNLGEQLSIEEAEKSLEAVWAWARNAHRNRDCGQHKDAAQQAKFFIESVDQYLDAQWRANNLKRKEDTITLLEKKPVILKSDRERLYKDIFGEDPYQFMINQLRILVLEKFQDIHDLINSEDENLKLRAKNEARALFYLLDEYGGKDVINYIETTLKIDNKAPGFSDFLLWRDLHHIGRPIEDVGLDRL